MLSYSSTSNLIWLGCWILRLNLVHGSHQNWTDMLFFSSVGVLTVMDLHYFEVCIYTFSFFKIY